MCKFNPKSGDTRIDPCMRKLIEELNFILDMDHKIIASCCGHGKYSMTIVVGTMGNQTGREIVHGIHINRKKKFYKRDSKGYYYIPEVVEEK